MKSTLISPAYASLNRELHETNADYGTNAASLADFLLPLIKNNNVRSILDYGCGKGTLKPALLAQMPALDIAEYDPAIPGKETVPDMRPDLLVASDIMEHIEPDYLDAVLQHLCGLKPSAVFMNISTTPANKSLPDGRNAHLIVQPAAWWHERLAQYLTPIYVKENPTGYIYVGVPVQK